MRRNDPKLAALLTVLLLGAGVASAAVKVKVYEGSRKIGTGTQTHTVVSLDSGKTVFTVGRFGSSVGIGPNGANWYSQDCFTITVDKQRSTKVPCELKAVKSGPDAGIVEAVWSFEAGPVKATFELRDGDGKLLVTVQFPKAKSRGLSLRCYPSTFAGGWKQGMKLRQRRGVTAVREMAMGSTVKGKGALSPEETWVLFQDDHFDVAKTKKKAEGPCAVLYNPQEAAKAWASVDNYACYFSLTPKADVDAVHLMVWDFQGLTNAEALDYMKKLKVTPE